MGKNKKSNSGFALLLGAAAGAAAGYWLNTTQGKLWRKEMMDQTSDLRNEMDYMSTAARDKAKEFSSSVGDYANQAKSKATSFADDISSKVTQTAQEGKDFIVNKANDLAHQAEKHGMTPKEAVQEGVDKAKARLNDLNTNV